ncbi:MAG: ABC transporter permease [Patescibacteria group bacterium]
MILKHLFKSALISLAANKMRSGLTVLGIVIGIMAIILVQGIGSGARNLILGQIQGLGSNTIMIEPGREPKGPSDFTSFFLDSLKEREVKYLKSQADYLGIKEISPIIFLPATVSFMGETKSVNVIGSSDLVEKILDLYPEEGLFFTEEDVLARSSVVLVGAEVKKELLANSKVIGQKIRIKNKNFQIVGSFSSKGQVGFFNLDTAVIMPYTTAMEYLSGTNYYNEIIVQAKNGEQVEQIKKNLEQAIRQLHGISNPEKDDFHVMTQEDIVKRVDTITGVLTALLVSVAAVSLIVGGVGIMNIMLVSVTERTREIGLRKALGATEKHILIQFIFEAVVLTFLGGVFGVLAGAGLTFLATLILSKFVSSGWGFSFPIPAALIGLLVSFLIGLGFGFYPARQAAKKDPIEALRYE